MKLYAPTQEQIETVRKLEQEFQSTCNLYQNLSSPADKCCIKCPYGTYVGSCFPLYLVQKFMSHDSQVSIDEILRIHSAQQEILKKARSQARMMYDPHSSTGIDAVDVYEIDRLIEEVKQ